MHLCPFCNRRTINVLDDDELMMMMMMIAAVLGLRGAKTLANCSLVTFEIALYDHKSPTSQTDGQRNRRTYDGTNNLTTPVPRFALRASRDVTL